MIGTVVTGCDSVFQFHINPEEFVINYERWDIPHDNVLLIAPNVVRSEGMFFEEKYGGQRVGLALYQPDSLQTNLTVLFEHFQLAFLTRAVQTETDLLGGIVNGELQVEDILGNFTLKTNLHIEDFSLFGDTLGNLAVYVQNEENAPSVYALDIALTERGNDVHLTGTYQLAEDRPCARDWKF